MFIDLLSNAHLPYRSAFPSISTQQMKVVDYQQTLQFQPSAAPDSPFPFSTMSDAALERYSASSSEYCEDIECEDTVDLQGRTRIICKAFSSPAAKVFLKTADDVIFQVEELYLKASRYVFIEDIFVDFL
jgi:hypothetical protein